MKYSIQSIVLLIPLLIALTCFNDMASPLALSVEPRQGEVILDELAAGAGECYGESLSAFRVVLDSFITKP